MKEILKKDSTMVKAVSPGLMANPTKETSPPLKKAAKEYSSFQMDQGMKESLKKMNSMDREYLSGLTMSMKGSTLWD